MDVSTRHSNTFSTDCNHSAKRVGKISIAIITFVCLSYVGHLVFQQSLVIEATALHVTPRLCKGALKVIRVEIM